MDAVMREQNEKLLLLGAWRPERELSTVEPMWKDRQRESTQLAEALLCGGGPDPSDRAGDWSCFPNVSLLFFFPGS